MWVQLLDFVSRYGYFGIFASMMLGIVGLPIPDETLLVFSGYMASSGQLKLSGALCAGYLGAICGISISYTLGRTVGYTVVSRYGRWFHLTPERADRVTRWFERYGGWTLVFAYYVAGVRHLAALLAGSTRMPYFVFARFAYPAAILWVTVFVSAGYVLGENWSRAVEWAHRAMIPILIAVVLAALAAWATSVRRRRERLRATLHQ